MGSERERLRTLVNKAVEQLEQQPEGGFIVRTVAEGASEEDLIADIPFLQKLWADLAVRIKKTKVPSVIYEDLPLFMRTLRDLVKPHIEKVRVDSREVHARMMQFANQYAPEIAGRIEHYPGERPLFDLYSVEDEVQKALNTK